MSSHILLWLRLKCNSERWLSLLPCALLAWEGGRCIEADGALPRRECPADGQERWPRFGRTVPLSWRSVAGTEVRGLSPGLPLPSQSRSSAQVSLLSPPDRNVLRAQVGWRHVEGEVTLRGPGPLEPFQGQQLKLVPCLRTLVVARVCLLFTP